MGTEQQKFDPVGFFYRDEERGFTICAIAARTGGKRRFPAEIRGKFGLRPKNRITYLGYGMVPKTVLAVDGLSFMFRSNTEVGPGMPIFNGDWKMQGIVGTSSHIGDGNYEMR
jgi:hypothetical protein